MDRKSAKIAAENRRMKAELDKIQKKIKTDEKIFFEKKPYEPDPIEQMQIDERRQAAEENERFFEQKRRAKIAEQIQIEERRQAAEENKRFFAMRDLEEENREMKADETIEVEEIICGTVEIMKNKWMNFKTENDETVIKITVPWRPGDKRVTLMIIDPYPLGKVTFLESVVSNLRYLLSKMLNSKSFEKVNENDDIYVRSGGVGQYTNEKEIELYKKLSFKKVDPPRMGEPDLMKTKIFEFQKKLNFYIGRTHELKYEDEDEIF